jgi:hypothetical protein
MSMSMVATERLGRVTDWVGASGQSYSATHCSNVRLLTFGTFTVLSSHAAGSRPRK